MLDNFDEFINDIFESYDNPVEIKWLEDNNGISGIFEVSKIMYKIQCKLYENNIWTFKFIRYDIVNKTQHLDMVKTNTNHKMCILGTIRKGMEYLIDVKSPNGLIFSAFDKSLGRKKLYLTYANEIVDKYDYHLRTNLQDDKLIFILYKDLNLNYIIDIIGDIIDDFNQA